ncbi:MAG: DUF1492 domain-containing protein [Firmicutes bacterium]|nr:DUF1492 domain-containing protein [Bacillota bacterium]
MNAKEYLTQAFKLDERINCKIEQASSLRDLACKVTASINDDRISGTKQKSPMENAIVKLVDLEREIDKDIDELIDLKREIINIINLVKNQNYRLILELRYINGKTWDDIATKMQYDLRWIYRLHGRALREIDKNIKKPLKDTKQSDII